jgi:hypothetical protein
MPALSSFVISFRVDGTERASINQAGNFVRRTTGESFSTSDVVRVALSIGLSDLEKLVAAANNRGCK